MVCNSVSNTSQILFCHHSAVNEVWYICTILVNIPIRWVLRWIDPVLELELSIIKPDLTATALGFLERKISLSISFGSLKIGMTL